MSPPFLKHTFGRSINVLFGADLSLDQLPHPAVLCTSQHIKTYIVSPQRQLRCPSHHLAGPGSPGRRGGVSLMMQAPAVVYTLTSMSQGPSFAPALEHVPSAPTFYSKCLCIFSCLSFAQLMMLLSVPGCLSPLHLPRCQVQVTGASALPRHCLASCRAAGHSLSTGLA